MYEVAAIKTFVASHAIGDCRGGSEERHSHEWKCEVRLLANALDNAGCAIDFAMVDGALERILAPLSGRLLNEISTFADVSPSAENVARYIHGALSGSLKHKVSRVTVWEDENHAAAYFE